MSTLSQPTRRDVLAASGALVAVGLLPTELALAADDPNAVRPFHVAVPDKQLTDLQQRLKAVRWTDNETVADASQGVQLATLKALVERWSNGYDWRKVEQQLNALPQFVTTIDGLDVHFIHVKSQHANALPLLITHGWPGSIIEMLGVIDPLTNPTAHGGGVDDAFDVVIPSIPGYGFSAQPTSVGWSPLAVAQAWGKLMERLGYVDGYVAQGGDIGATVTDTLARLAPKGLLGVHFNLLASLPPAIAAAIFGGRPVPDLPDDEKLVFAAVARTNHRGYLIEQLEHPQTIGFGLADSPVGLAAWMLDHDADSYAKITKAILAGEASGGLTTEHALDNITLYWLTNTAASAARLYWEAGQLQRASAGKAPAPVNVPVGYTVFPGELYKAPRTWLEQVYPKLTYYHEAERGGHFAAWEEPDVFAAEMRAAFKSLRAAI